MFGALKNSHNATMFSTKLGLAYNWMDDTKVPKWIEESYTYYQKVRDANADRICWTSEDATKFALWLTAISHVVPQLPLQERIAEMHKYFTARSVQR
jgi:hypothetical protein